jgi:hypothetical protein
MNAPIKFHEMLKEENNLWPHREDSFALNSIHMNADQVLYCKEMVRQGKLASFDYCSDQGANNPSLFRKNTLFYERGLSLARRKVYTFRLPLFGASVSFKHGKEAEFTWRNVKIKKTTKEKAEQESLEILSGLFKMYIIFIRCWVAKSYLSYEEAYTILKHYSDNDGIITIPEFAESALKLSLSEENDAISKSESIKQLFVFNLFCVLEEHSITPVCINESIKVVECPFCLTQAICEDGGIVKCSGCKKEFMGA